MGLTSFVMGEVICSVLAACALGEEEIVTVLDRIFTFYPNLCDSYGIS